MTLVKTLHAGAIRIDPEHSIEGIEPAGHAPSIPLAFVYHETPMEKKAKDRGMETVGTHKRRMVNQPYKLRWPNRKMNIRQVNQLQVIAITSLGDLHRG